MASCAGDTRLDLYCSSHLTVVPLVPGSWARSVFSLQPWAEPCAWLTANRNRGQPPRNECVTEGGTHTWEQPWDPERSLFSCPCLHRRTPAPTGTCQPPRAHASPHGRMPAPAGASSASSPRRVFPTCPLHSERPSRVGKSSLHHLTSPGVPSRGSAHLGDTYASSLFLTNPELRYLTSPRH